MTETTTPDYQRLGAAVKARRLALLLRQSDMPVSPARVGQIEQGRPFPMSAQTKSKLAHVLGWAPDSIDRLLGGGDAVLLEQPTVVT